MAKFRTCDVMIELAEFALELVGDVSIQLRYHRASVYKQETSTKINLLETQLRSVTRILNDEMVNEVFADFDSFSKLSGQDFAPGDCVLSLRINHLVKELKPAIEEYKKRVFRKKGTLTDEQLQAIMEQRRSLLAVCRKGTRSWELLKSL